MSTDTQAPAQRKITVYLEGLNREVVITVPDSPKAQKEAKYKIWQSLTDAERNAMVCSDVIEDEPV